jgi:hypothetical protein
MVGWFSAPTSTAKKIEGWVLTGFVVSLTFSNPTKKAPPHVGLEWHRFGESRSGANAASKHYASNCRGKERSHFLSSILAIIGTVAHIEKSLDDLGRVLAMALDPAGGAQPSLGHARRYS